jgi:cell filamentation protein
VKPIRDEQFDDQHGVLRNLLGIINPDHLTAAAASLSYPRLIELDARPLQGSFDASHLRAMHRYIFQDVFPWAGEFRTVRTSRSDSFGFPPPMFIAQALDTLFAHLANEKHLRQLTREAFAERAAFYLGEINAVHAFRDGNGRAQREFIRTLALQAGHSLTWTGLTKAENDEASRLSFTKGDNSALAAIIRIRLG